MKSNRNRVESVIKYINNHYEDELTLDELAGVACYSSFHFQRVFSEHVGDTPFNFIKRIRLENSVIKLICSDKSIADIAFEANYSSVANYNKAFKLFYKSTPSKFRKESKNKGFTACSVADLDFEMSVKSLDEMTLACSTYKGELNFNISLAWQAIYQWARDNHCFNKETKQVAITLENPITNPVDEYTYLACLSVHQQLTPTDNIQFKNIKGGLYASLYFHGKYSEIINAYRYFFESWLFESGYLYNASKDILQMIKSKNNCLDQGNAEIVIYFPILRASHL